MSFPFKIEPSLEEKEKLLLAYISGKKFAYRNNDTGIILYKKANPYDNRTKEGRAWILGWAHGCDEQNGMFFALPSYCIRR